MKTLHLLRTEPDDTVLKFLELLSDQEKSKSISLYDENVDWSELVDEIFSHDKVICWW